MTTRRRFLQTLATLAALSTTSSAFGGPPGRGQQAASPPPPSPPRGELITRPIPASGERLPVIGLGTSRTFDVGTDPEAQTRLRAVLSAFFAQGGRLIDSSPMYGSAEAVLGALLAALKPARLFAATKVWTDGREAGIAQMERSRALWGVARFDLMQIHNLRDWEVHIETLKQWKAEGKIRYIGITTSHGRAHEELARALEREPFDFVQFSYSLAERKAESRLLPLAAERGIAVIVNRPFARGELFDKVRGRDLPEWAREFDCTSWAQFFLKFVVSHPAVTCAIPATSKVEHMADNMAAGFGRLPDEALRRRMLAYMESL
jgi:diketogulonate reductase-like aldo/keto reductase